MTEWKFPYYDVESGIDWDAIEENFDWFRDMKGVPQDPIWHAEGDVQIHTKMVCEALIDLPEFKELSEQDKHVMVTAALMHDIEKRSTTMEEERDGRICIVAPRHAQKGEYTARKILYKDIPTPFHIREKICKLVRFHGAPLWKPRDGNLEKKVVEVSLYVKNSLVAMIAKADVLGRTADDNPEMLERIEFYKMIAEDLHCLNWARQFYSEHTKVEYLRNGGWIGYVPHVEHKFWVYMIVGIAGTGKDTYIKEHFKSPVLSLDNIRCELNIKPTDKKGNGKVIQEAKERAKVFMRDNQDFVFNATNITADMRRKWISLFEDYGGTVLIHYLEVPYETLKKQNKNREHSVPDEIIEKMINKLEIPMHHEATQVNYRPRIEKDSK